MTRRPLLAAALAAIALVGLAGCGGDSDDTTADPGREEVTLDLAANDFAFAPATLTAPPGARVKVRVTNTGAAPHTFTAAAAGVDEQFEAGQAGEVELTMPASGSLAFVCKLHETQGMVGTIEPR